MGRKKTGREVPLYVRVTKENDRFLSKMCRETGQNRTALIDTHLDLLRNTLGAKAREYFPQKGAKVTW